MEVQRSASVSQPVRLRFHGALRGGPFALVAIAPGIAAWLLPAGEQGDGGVLAVAAAAGTVGVGWLILATRGRLPKPSSGLLLVIALALRLLAVAGPARFDDDVWRYLWDGAVTTAGVSPFEFTPREVRDADPDFDPLLYEPDELARLERLRALYTESPRSALALSRLNFPQFPTIYPPTSQIAFAAVAAVAPASDRLWRATAALADWLAVWLLVRLLAALGRPRWWAAAYGLHPLPALESGAGGHQDALGIALLLAAAWALAARRRAQRGPIAAGSLLALAAGVKLFPLLLTVPWVRALGRRGLLALAATGLLLILPFALLGPIDLAGLSVYVRRWEYFSGPFAVLAAPGEWLGLEPTTARWVGRGLALLVLGLLLAALRRRRPTRLEGLTEVTGGLVWIEALILLSPVVNPWYVSWALAVGAVRRSLAWPVFALLVPLAYLPFPGGEHPWWLRALAWLPLVILLAFELRSPPVTGSD